MPLVREARNGTVFSERACDRHTVLAFQAKSAIYRKIDFYRQIVKEVTLWATSKW
jgi:hypothetical protein